VNVPLFIESERARTPAAAVLTASSSHGFKEMFLYKIKYVELLVL